jgi:acetate kinase
MKILVLNRGSSSVKCSLYEFQVIPSDPLPPLWEGHLEWKNTFDEAQFKVSNHQGQSLTQKIRKKSADLGINVMLDYLIKGPAAVISTFDEVDLIGHRIVHGGKDFHEAVLIDHQVKRKIEALSELAPLHNPPGLAGIEIMEKHFPHQPQIAVFDTSFHHTLPDFAKIYPIAYKWYEEGIQRFGFHGISFQYCYSRANQLLGQDLSSSKIIICHLGSGGSLCAIHEGQSKDTTMGFTPLEGLMMDTRSGSIDPGIILHLLMKKNKTAEELYTELNKKSGLLGISGISSDMRDILEKSESEDPRATLALEIFLHRLNSCIGSMIASLKGVDLIIFTAGIGENASLIRKKVCDNFSFLNLKIDDNKNNERHQEDTLLSDPDSQVKVLLIHTQEAFQIAKESFIKGIRAKG